MLIAAELKFYWLTCFYRYGGMFHKAHRGFEKSLYTGVFGSPRGFALYKATSMYIKELCKDPVEAL